MDEAKSTTKEMLSNSNLSHGMHTTKHLPNMGNICHIKLKCRGLFLFHENKGGRA